MSLVENGKLRHVSVSRANTFDHKQQGGCELRFWFETVQDLKEESGPAAADGDAGHALLATYLTTGEKPTGRVKMGKAVTGAIVKGELVAPGADLLVEWRFSGQPKFHPTAMNEDGTPKWLDLDTEKTLWLGGLPWEGFVDVAHRRQPIPEVIDHKFGADPRVTAKQADQLIRTIQMPTYVLALLRRPEFADATRWRITHHNVSRKGVDSFMRSAVVTLDQVLERKADIEAIVGRMTQVVQAKTQDEVPFNRKSCHEWMGCPHQSICNRFKEKNKVQLTAEELALFNDLDETSAPVAASVPPEEEDPFEEAASSIQASAQIPDSTPAPKSKMTIVDAEPEAFGMFCGGCGAPLTSANASKKDDKVKHIGCPKAIAPVLAPDAPKSDPKLAAEQPQAEPPAKPKKPKKVDPAQGTLTEAPAPVTLPIPPAMQAAMQEITKASAPPTEVTIRAANPDPINAPQGISGFWPKGEEINLRDPMHRLARAFRAFADDLEKP